MRDPTGTVSNLGENLHCFVSNDFLLWLRLNLLSSASVSQRWWFSRGAANPRHVVRDVYWKGERKPTLRHKTQNCNIVHFTRENDRTPGTKILSPISAWTKLQAQRGTHIRAWAYNFLRHRPVSIALRKQRIPCWFSVMILLHFVSQLVFQPEICIHLLKGLV